MSKKPQIAAIVCLFILNASFPTQAGAPLDGEQLTTTLSGNTLENYHKGTKYYTLIKADGTLSGKGGGNEDTGTWHVSDKGYWCRSWSSWADAKESCFEVSHNKKDKYKFKRKTGSGGNVKVKLLEGNPKDL